jgi:ArsR family transcriptional regulator
VLTHVLAASLDPAVMAGRSDDARRALPRPLSGQLIDLLAERLLILGSSKRIRLLDILDISGELTVQALAARVEAPQQTVSDHLTRLHSAGVLSRRQHGRSVFYSIADPEVMHVYAVALASLENTLCAAVSGSASSIRWGSAH